MNYVEAMTIDMFRREIAAAGRAYERYIVCLDKTPEDFEMSLVSLMEKAIKAYESRGAGLRHGIAQRPALPEMADYIFLPQIFHGYSETHGSLILRQQKSFQSFGNTESPSGE